MTQLVRASQAPASSGDAVPPEWWETVAGRLARWKGRRSEVWVRLRTARWVLLWVTLVGAMVLAVVAPAVRTVLVVALSGVLMLVAMYAMARTKTLSWQAIGLLYSAGLWWAMAIAAISAWVTVDVTGLFDNAIVRYTPVAAAGAGTAVAALTEECLKLLPLAVLAVVAPGRVRRFAAVDWLLVGFASGLAFMVAEESARTVQQAVEPSAWWTILGQEPAGVTWWPFGRGFESTMGPISAWYAGHQVITALVAGSCGIAVALWRGRASTLSRMAALAVVPMMWWLAVVDHFGFNASAQSPTWLDGDTSSAPALLRWSFSGTGHGWGRAWLLGAVLIAAMAIDARRVWPARQIGGLPNAPGWALRWTNRPGLVGAAGCLAALVVRDLQVVVVAHARDGAEPRRVAAARGRAAAVMLRVLRAEELRAQTDGAPPVVVVGARRRVRWWGWAALAVLGVIGTLGAAWLAVRIGPLLLKVFVTGWFAGVLEGLGEWWNGLPLWQQIAIGVGIAALIALSGGSLGLAFGVSGVVTYGLSHGRGLGALVRDPQGATGRYVTEATPGGVALDLLDFGLTFAPGNFAGAAAGRGIRQVAREFANDPDAFRAAVRARHLDDTGSVELPLWRGRNAAIDLRSVMETWPNPKVRFANVEILMDKRDMRHFLSRHHPIYWNNSVKDTQTFFDEEITLEQVHAIAMSVLEQHKDSVIATAGNRLRVSGTVGGVEYVVALLHGHVSQIYPR